jgi:3-deoxy-D-manno-octulosonate 8-phosphate phosphatase (KDO 8-P phosphatase)
MMDAAKPKLLGKIRAVAMDVDGVLTDGTFWWDEGNLELKRFCFADITGMPLAQRAGIKLALISGESSQSGMAIVERYAKKLKIEDVFKGCRDKVAALRQFAGRHSLDLAEICYIGDDIGDLAAMDAAGLSVAPSNAHPSALKKADIITKKEGGCGAVRELLDAILLQKS